MPVPIHCGPCNRTYQVDPAAGKVARCPNGHLLVIPANLRAQTPSPAAPASAVRPKPKTATHPTPARPTPPSAATPRPQSPKVGAAVPAPPARRGGLGIFALVCLCFLVLLVSAAGGAALVLLSPFARQSAPQGPVAVNNVAEPPLLEPKGAQENPPAGREDVPPSAGRTNPTPPRSGQGNEKAGGEVDTGRTPTPKASGSDPATPGSSEPSHSPPAVASKLDFSRQDRLDRSKLDFQLPPPRPEEKPPEVLDGHTNHVRCVAFTHDSQFVISVSGDWNRKIRRPPDNSIRVWDAPRHLQVHKVEGFPEALNSLSLSRGGRYAFFSHGDYWDGNEYVRTKDNGVYMWDIQAKRTIGPDEDLKAPPRKEEQGGKLRPRFTGLDLSVYATAISPDQDCGAIVGGGAAKHIILWDTFTAKPLLQGPVPPIKGFLEGVRCLKFSPDGRYIIVANADDTLRMFQASTGTVVGKPLEDHKDIIWALDVDQTKEGTLRAISGGGSRQLASDDGFEPGARDYEIRLWDLLKGQVIGRFRGHTEDVMGLAFCPDGRHFVSGSQDESVRLWDIPSGKEVRLLGRHEGIVRTVDVSPDGRTCVSGGEDCKVRFWHLPTAQDLVDALDRNRPADLEKAVEDMDVIGVAALPVFPRLVKTLEHSDSRFRGAAAKVLLRLAELSGSAGLPFEQLAVSDISKVVESDHPVALKLLAVQGLGKKGPEARPAAPVLVKFVQGKDDPQTLATVAESFGKIGAGTPEVVGLLSQWLRHADAAVRLRALLALENLGPDVLKLETVFERVDRDADRDIQARAETIFHERVRSATTADLAVLRKGLGSSRPQVRLDCLAVVVSFKDDGAPALPELTALLSGREAAVRLAALRAVQAVSGKDRAAVPAVARLIDPTTDRTMALEAIMVLNALDPRNSALVERGLPLVTDGLLAPDEGLRKLAAKAVGQLGPKAVAPLSLRLLDDDSERRRATAEALGHLGAAAEPAIPDLHKVLESDSKVAVRRAAADALGQIGPKALPTLIACLDHRDDNVRQLAAEGLGNMGAEAAPAIPALYRVASQDSKRVVSGAASRALKKIDPDWEKKLPK